MLRPIRDLLVYDRRFLIGFVLIGLLVTMAIVSFFNPHDSRSWGVFLRDLPPSWQNPLGTNSLGQDIFWNATEAVRNSMLIGIIAAVISRVIALALGLISGYRGGLFDRTTMTVNDSFIIIPLFPLLILISTMVSGRLNIILLGVILGLFGWAWDSRLFRSQILSLKEREFTQTAVFSGMGAVRIVTREHLPFVIPLVMAATINNIIWVIGMEVTLAVLGLSSLNTPTIGTMLYWALQYQAIFLGRWFWLLTPLVICIALIIGLYLLSVSISEYMDPRTRVQRITLKRG